MYKLEQFSIVLSFWAAMMPSHDHHRGQERNWAGMESQNEEPFFFFFYVVLISAQQSEFPVCVWG